MSLKSEELKGKDSQEEPDANVLSTEVKENCSSPIRNVSLLPTGKKDRTSLELGAQAERTLCQRVAQLSQHIPELFPDNGLSPRLCCTVPTSGALLCHGFQPPHYHDLLY